jgi:hypothetical protein
MFWESLVMKKKFFACLFFCLFVFSSLYADFNYQLDFVSLDPLYKEYFADRARPNLSINYLSFSEGFPDRVLQDNYNTHSTDVNEVKVWEFDRILKPDGKMVEVSLGETMSLVRNTFTFDNWLSPISFDISMQGLLQSFYQGGFDDNIGYDGIYFIGGTLRIADLVSMRIGRHHYCSHYGDAIVKAVKSHNNPSFNEFWMTYKYVRMDAYTVGLSIEPSSNLRLYGELNFPPRTIKSVRPDMFAPNWVMRNGFYINPTYPDWYNARIINVGIELNYPIFKSLGDTTFGYDLHMYEEGKIIYDHVNGGLISFDENAPWELEHNIRIAQELNNTVSLEFTYHNGRSPFNNLYFQHTQYVSFGLKYNPDDTVTLFNTNKK